MLTSEDADIANGVAGRLYKLLQPRTSYFAAKKRRAREKPIGVYKTEQQARDKVDALDAYDALSKGENHGG